MNGYEIRVQIEMNPPVLKIGMGEIALRTKSPGKPETMGTSEFNQPGEEK